MRRPSAPRSSRSVRSCLPSRARSSSASRSWIVSCKFGGLLLGTWASITRRAGHGEGPTRERMPAGSEVEEEAEGEGPETGPAALGVELLRPRDPRVGEAERAVLQRDPAAELRDDQLLVHAVAVAEHRAVEERVAHDEPALAR